MRYLADTSTVVRVDRGQVDPQWIETVKRGLVAVCEPVLAETLTLADAKQYEIAEERLRAAYPWVPVADNVWELVAAIRRDLGERSAHQGVSVADYVIAATAIRLKLVLLHEDGDFETIARFIPELKQRRISTLP